MCTGCEVCVGECPVGAIVMDDGAARINDERCIRCGVCHEACPAEAVRHDGERTPEDVKSNLDWVRRLLENDYYANDEEKQAALMKRLERHFAREIEVARRTIEQLPGER